MNRMQRQTRWLTAIAVAGALGVHASCQSMGMMGGQQIALSGTNEVPAVTTTASGTGTVTIKDDRSVTASITVSGMTPTAAHIHEGASGAIGPVIVPFTKTGDNTFAAPAGAKLTDAQYAAYKAGNLYVNVHSAANKSGEIRGQLKP